MSIRHRDHQLIPGRPLRDLSIHTNIRHSKYNNENSAPTLLRTLAGRIQFSTRLSTRRDINRTLTVHLLSSRLSGRMNRGSSMVNSKKRSGTTGLAVVLRTLSRNTISTSVLRARVRCQNVIHGHVTGVLRNRRTNTRRLTAVT